MKKPKWAPKRLMDLKGWRLKTMRELQNKLARIPAGTVVTVDYFTGWEKLSVVGDPCKCCGVAVVISRVSVWEFEPAIEAIPAGAEA